MIVQTDSVLGLRSLPLESIDCITTDPPYASLDKHRAVGTTTRLHADGWFDTVPNEYFVDWFEAAYSRLKPNAHLYFFCDQETMFAVKPMGEAAGFKFWKPLVWDKRKIGMGYHYRARYEFILFFEKGKRRLADLGIPDVLEADRVRGEYPTEKPVSLLQTLIRQSSSEGELIVDPFCGSGSAGEAAKSLNRRFIGFDTSPRAIELSTKRI